MARTSRALFNRITPQQLDDLCRLIGSGLATREAAVEKVCSVGRRSFHLSFRQGEAAHLRWESGEDLTEDDQKAAEFYRRICTASGERKVRLATLALGYKSDGKRESRLESRNAMHLLQISSPELMRPNDLDQEDQAKEAAESVSDEAVLAGLARIRDTRPDLLAAAGLRADEPTITATVKSWDAP